MRLCVFLVAMLVTSLAGCGCEADSTDTADAPLQTYSAEVGCQGSFRIEPGFSTQQDEEIRNAAARWNTFLGRDYFQVSELGTCPILPTELPDGKGAAIDAQRSKIGIDLARLARSGFDRGLWFEAIVMHELGHSLGMGHVDKAIMGEDRKALSLDFTENDRAECQRVGMCP